MVARLASRHGYRSAAIFRETFPNRVDDKIRNSDDFPCVLINYKCRSFRFLVHYWLKKINDRDFSRQYNDDYVDSRIRQKSYTAELQKWKGYTTHVRPTITRMNGNNVLFTKIRLIDLPRRRGI